MSSLKKYKNTDQWKQDSGRFIPNPETWINQERWDDEIEQEIDINEIAQQIING